MKFCQECGFEMQDHEMICSNCGTYQTALKRSGVQNLIDPFIEDEAAEGQKTEDQENAHDAPPESAYSGYTYSSGHSIGGEQTNSGQGNNRAYESAFETENSEHIGERSGRSHGSDYGMNHGESYGASYGPGGRYGQPNPNAYYYDNRNDMHNADGGMDDRFTSPGAGAGFRIDRYSFLKYFLLALVTCGIFGVYYMYKWTEDTNRLSQGVYKPSMNYILVILLGIVTCGIYPLVWTYQQGERLKTVGDRNGIQINESGVHHLLLTLLIPSVGMLISQYIFFNNTNRLSSVYNGDATREEVNQNPSHVVAIVVGIIIGVLGLSTSVGIGTALARRNASNFNYNYDYNYDYDFNLDDFGFGDFDFDDWEGVTEFDSAISVGESAVFEDAEVEIVKALKVKDINDDPALAVTLRWTNLSDEETSAMWMFMIEARQGDYPLYTTWPKLGDKDVDINSYSKRIATGESLEFQMLFSLDNESEPVDVSVMPFLNNSGTKADCRFTL